MEKETNLEKGKTVIGVDDKVPVPKALAFGAQHFMAFISGGAIVPALLMGLNPSLALLCCGIGTIMYMLVTRNRIPAFFGVSFSFISPVVLVGATQGVEAALCGVIAAGVIYIIIGIIIKFTGTGWLYKIFPPVLIGSIIAVIGIGLSPDAIMMVFFNNDMAAGFNGTSFLIGIATLALCIVFSSFFKGFISTIPILLAMVIGYIISLPFGFVDFSAVEEAAWIGLPTLVFPTFSFSAILIIAPIAFVVIVEHIGKLMLIGKVIDRDCVKLLPQSLIGNGLATMMAGFFGTSALTPIAENIGVMGVTRVFASRVMYYAAGFAIIAGGFCPKLSALILSIPTPVLGGVSLLLFGIIATSGIRVIVDNQVDFNNNKNLMIASTVLIIGIGMMTSFISIPIGSFSLPGLLVATLVGVVINLVVPNSQENDKLPSVKPEPPEEQTLVPDKDNNPSS